MVPKTGIAGPRFPVRATECRHRKSPIPAVPQDMPHLGQFRPRNRRNRQRSRRVVLRRGTGTSPPARRRSRCGDGSQPSADPGSHRSLAGSRRDGHRRPGRPDRVSRRSNRSDSNGQRAGEVPGRRIWSIETTAPGFSRTPRRAYTCASVFRQGEQLFGNRAGVSRINLWYLHTYACNGRRPPLAASIQLQPRVDHGAAAHPGQATTTVKSTEGSAGPHTDSARVKRRVTGGSTRTAAKLTENRVVPDCGIGASAAGYSRS